MALYLTVGEVAERWSCSARQVRRLCQSGELRAMRLGQEAWRIPVTAVEAYERRQTAATTEPAAVKPAASTTSVATRAADGFALPADYEPVFPDLWPGHAPQPTKKAPVRAN